MAPEPVRAFTPVPDILNEWVVEVEGIRRARYVGPDAIYYASRAANKWRQMLRRDLPATLAADPDAPATFAS